MGNHPEEIQQVLVEEHINELRRARSETSRASRRPESTAFRAAIGRRLIAIGRSLTAIQHRQPLAGAGRRP